MVQYWEAVASGTPMVEAAAVAGVTAEEAAAAEAYATAAVAAAEAALAEQEQAAAAARAEQGTAELQLQAGQGWAVAMAQAVTQELQEAEAPAEPAMCATPSTLTARLPAGEAATPCSQPVAAALRSGDGTPARFAPLNFVAAPPPTPQEGIDLQQAQQLHSLDVGMAAAAAAAGTVAGSSAASTPAGTPTSALRTASRLPATPAGTPYSVGTPAGTPQSLATPAGTPASSRAAAAALAVTPLALSALRARMAGSGGGVQDAVRSRLARLKADLQAAQAKLATVDQVGLGRGWLGGRLPLSRGGSPWRRGAGRCSLQGHNAGVQASNTRPMLLAPAAPRCAPHTCAAGPGVYCLHPHLLHQRHPRQPRQQHLAWAHPRHAAFCRPPGLPHRWRRVACPWRRLSRGRAHCCRWRSSAAPVCGVLTGHHPTGTSWPGVACGAHGLCLWRASRDMCAGGLHPACHAALGTFCWQPASQQQRQGASATRDSPLIGGSRRGRGRAGGRWGQAERQRARGCRSAQPCQPVGLACCGQLPPRPNNTERHRRQPGRGCNSGGAAAQPAGAQAERSQAGGWCRSGPSL